VYAVAPTDDLSKIRNVHRSSMRTLIRREAPRVVHSDIPLMGTPSSLGDEEEVDLWVAVSDDWQVGSGQTMALQPATVTRCQPSALLVTQQTPASLLPEPPPVVSAPLVIGELAPDVDLGLAGVSVSLPSNQQGDSVRAVRRTRRATAGQHPNVHHLPRAVENVRDVQCIPGSISSITSGLFRPWD
jgi:hypothetical protein